LHGERAKVRKGAGGAPKRTGPKEARETAAQSGRVRPSRSHTIFQPADQNKRQTLTARSCSRPSRYEHASHTERHQKARFVSPGKSAANRD